MRSLLRYSLLTTALVALVIIGIATHTRPLERKVHAQAGPITTAALLISSFRFNGPKGSGDEFVEIFNPAATAVTVSNLSVDPSVGTISGLNGTANGIGVFASQVDGSGGVPGGNPGNTNGIPSLACQIPGGTVIPPRGYFLCVGTAYSLANLGANGGAGGTTASGNATIGTGNASCVACTKDLADGSALIILPVGTNIADNSAGGFFASGVSGLITPIDRVGPAAYGGSAPSSSRAANAANYCDGTCYQPVGDASNKPTCEVPTNAFGASFPVTTGLLVGGIYTQCYGQSGQYKIERRQNVFNANSGTLYINTRNNAQDFGFFSPNPGFNVGGNLTNISGVTSVLGAAGPHNSSAPSDMGSNIVSNTPYDTGQGFLGQVNAERIFYQRQHIANAANDPLGTFALRRTLTNLSATGITGFRARLDDLSTLCGPQTSATTGGGATATAEARNLAASPNCQGAESFSAILKAVNSFGSNVVTTGGVLNFVNGAVLEDISGAPTPAPIGGVPLTLSPLGGGIDNSYVTASPGVVFNPSGTTNVTGDGVTGGVGVFLTPIAGPGGTVFIEFDFGVLRPGHFKLLTTVEAVGPSPLP